MSKKKIRNEKTDLDVEMALSLHQKYNALGLTENAVFPENEKNLGDYQPRTLVDQTLEIIDPTPNIYTLFSQFDAKFFSNKLVSVEVKWSQRMTSCAGVCSFHPRSRDCIISLSAPLLKLRPRKDLVETLLHEMIHGYLFLTNNNRDRDGHGPEFRKIMDRINKEAGTRITIYHSFHDEVKLYQQHWWRCNGPCQNQPPYFGTVRRAMNRAPGPSDFWWESHRQRCNGQFIKVREPEKKKASTSTSRDSVKENKKPKGKASSAKPDKKLDDWFSKSSGGNSGVSSTAKVTTVSPMNSSTKISPKLNDYGRTKEGISTPGNLVKLGTRTNNVYGWGTGGPGSSCSNPTSSSKQTPKNSKPGNSLHFSGTLGGAGTGRSNLLDKYHSPNVANRGSKHSASPIEISDDPTPTKKPKIVDSSQNNGPTSVSKEPNVPVMFNCPVCDKRINSDRMNDHLDVCLDNGSNQSDSKKQPPILEVFDSPEQQSSNRNSGKFFRTASTSPEGQKNLDAFVQSPKNDTGNIVSCPSCDKILIIDKLYDHLDRCLLDETDVEKDPRDIRSQGNNDSSPKKLETSLVDLTDVARNFDESYVCLVCNTKISGDIALTDHLEECVQTIFNNDDDTFETDNDTVEISSPKNKVENDKFPCPICMDLIPETLMNEHLDKCLLDNK